MSSIFRRSYPPAAHRDDDAIWLPFHGSALLVPNGDHVDLARGSSALLHDLSIASTALLGTLDERPCLACAVDGPPPNGAWRAIGLRELYGQVDETLYALAGYAAHMLSWQRTNRFCSACGGATSAGNGDWGAKCERCGHVAYPRVSPAILALVHDGDRVLLTHKPGWGQRYSIVAGFVEPGESLEDCVRREVAEEVGVQLGAVNYVGSQPWPFPDQLMIGFMCSYAGGFVQIDPSELDDARWFQVDELPELPPPLSLSRQIIDAWAAGRRAEREAGRQRDDLLAGVS